MFLMLALQLADTFSMTILLKQSTEKSLILFRVANDRTDIAHKVVYLVD